MTIEALLVKVSKGEKDALEKLYKKTVKLVFSVSLAIVKNVQDAEDVMSETFVSVWQNAKSFGGINGLAWVCAIAKNKSLNFIKQRDRWQKEELNENCLVSFGLEGDAQNRLVLQTALQVLDEKERQTVLLYNSGYKHREIAKILNEKIGTVTWRYQNSLQKMRKAMGGENE